MTAPRSAAHGDDVGAIADVLGRLAAGEPVRRKLEAGGRVHIDRPLPFLCVHAADPRSDTAARDVALANAAYIVTPDLAAAVPLINAVGRAMRGRSGGFIVVEVGELDRDRLLSDDSPFLPPFETIVTYPDDPAAREAFDAFSRAMESVKAKYRSSRIEGAIWSREADGWTRGLDPDFARLRIRFAPIYRQPETAKVYPELRQRVVANVFDAVLQAIAAWLAATGAMQLTTHRVLGRRVFVDAVRRVDARIDRVAGAFDFLLAVTPINADAALHEFETGGFARQPGFLYRPLTLEVDREKRRLFSIPFDNLEDPLLYELYREKQRELDLQLTLLAERGSPRFREASRMLYGPVEPGLLDAARTILARTEGLAGSHIGASGREGEVDCHALAREARRMIQRYRAAAPGFAPSIEVRDDLPAGMMVSGPRLLIARSTRIARRRVVALLSHEIGVHLFTYFAGNAQGLLVFRSGLAGYEGMQEGLGVFAEYLVGGMTPGRLHLVAARVVGCAAMLDGADFAETFRMLTRDHDFSDTAAFGIALRLYRSGGLSKDAIYLRGLLAVLDHMKQYGSLEPFWMGKISAEHFPVMQELHARGLLRSPAILPTFLSHPEAGARLEAARGGLSPVDLIAA